MRAESRDAGDGGSGAVGGEVGGEEIGVVVEAGPQAGDQQGREHEQQGGDEQRDAGWPLGHVQRDR